MRLVVALGGNALLRRGERPEARVQQEHVAEAVAALAPLAHQHELVVTHGNGPQVGLLAAQSSADPSLERPYPLDVIGAQTQGMIGYWITQALRSELPGRGVFGLLDQTLVAPDDPALQRPTKPVGPVLPEVAASAARNRYGWDLEREGDGWRRVVPSPEPLEVLETREIETLLVTGAVVVCGGGGGVPVTRGEGGRLRGVEAVVDKDLTSGLLAERIGADVLLLLTDVAGVIADRGTREPSLVRRLRRADVRDLDLPPGSMGPKVEAALRFVERTGGRAVVGDITGVADLVAGLTGTEVLAEGGS
ncbi:carbamate kinase [Marihabitans asiaticum]|uniref:Carbamate kinase n=1 Tax=Marihabitans asiaticum TaxID=415218 RepID=A0A560WAL5_9MICO|nr:carbamate kinase [Marihabitans asiaticum]TWD14673.1 carbamate kinase [Marihabitans asiaticum]